MAGPDDSYIQIYRLIQEGDQMLEAGQRDTARSRYLEAQSELQKFQRLYPSWETGTVQFRAAYVQEKLAPLGQAPSGAKTAVAETPAARKPATPAETVKMLEETVSRLESEKGVLNAKLQEALAVQPAAVDPRELAKAEAKIKVLEKERELLKVSLEQEQEKQAKAALGNPDKQTIESLKAEVVAVRKQLAEAKSAPAPAADQSALEDLKKENQNLKKLLTEAQAASGKTAAAVPAGVDPAIVTDLQGSLANLRRENAALQARLAATPVPAAPATVEAPALSAADKKAAKAENKRIKELEKERDDLQKRLKEATAKPSRKSAAAAEAEAKTFRARLAALEAQKTPYTPEELALFKAPAATPRAVPAGETKMETKDAKTEAAAKTPKALPPGSSADVTAAQQAFSQGKFGDAEAAYRKVLALDPKHPVVLGNLAVVQMEQGHFDQAEDSVKKALAEEPADPYLLSLQGILRFRQDKFDEALDILSRSAEMDPANAETQNYLGITLSQKGQRVAAEAALRKAIQLSPGYGAAHQNLAVIYATQKPPFLELARYHYQKSRALGHPENKDLEKMMDGSAPAAK